MGRVLTVFSCLCMAALLAGVALPVGAADRVVFIQAQDILSFAPAYVARSVFLPEAGIDAEFIITHGGAPVYAALASGTAHFGLTATTDFLSNVTRGAKFLAVETMVYQTMDVVVNRQWAEARGLTRESPIAERMEALKDAVIGSTSAGAISETMARYLVVQAGLAPDDAQIIPMGSLTVRQAALKRNQIQAYLSSPPGGPQAEAEGFGYVLIPSSELPGFSRQIHEILVTHSEWAAENPDVTRRVVTAFAKANNFILEHPEEALDLIRPYFENLGEDVLRASFNNVYPQIAPGGLMSQAGWEQTQTLLQAIGAVGGTADLREGLYWTNAYIDTSEL